MDVKFKWANEGKDAFKRIKLFAPTLHYKGFSLNFLLYTFASYHSLAIALMQNDEQGNEYYISFVSISFTWSLT